MNPNSSFRHRRPDVPGLVPDPPDDPWWAGVPLCVPPLAEPDHPVGLFEGICGTILSLLIVAFGTAGLVALLLRVSR
ncbi:MAG TPA: hypothetical protein VOB72_17675 [Candidatus Dormibacteraeota bacterium]|nr:hypothetical protein [Candidatus Dormibacteraeota bacterium]